MGEIWGLASDLTGTAGCIVPLFPSLPMDWPVGVLKIERLNIPIMPRGNWPQRQGRTLGVHGRGAMGECSAKRFRAGRTGFLPLGFNEGCAR